MAFFTPDTAFVRFPPPPLADADGLLLMGPWPTPERIIQAYRQGIFPWYNEEEHPLWWSPDPRFVIYPANLHISRSMQKLLRYPPFIFKLNTAFKEVIQQCAQTPRHGESGTWLTPEMIAAYSTLHAQGIAVSAEAWRDNTLVGGVYGLRMKNVFFAESMFSHHPNASKFALIKMVQWLAADGVKLIDAQVYSAHVESLGGCEIPRSLYLRQLRELI